MASYLLRRKQGGCRFAPQSGATTGHPHFSPCSGLDVRLDAGSFDDVGVLGLDQHQRTDPRRVEFTSWATMIEPCSMRSWTAYMIWFTSVVRIVKLKCAGCGPADNAMALPNPWFRTIETKGLNPGRRYSFAKRAAANKIMFTKAMNATVT